MTIVANTVVILVALLHIYFLVLEMFLWDKPSGLKAFGQSKEKAETTKVLAANQGLYNGFLAAGLLLGVYGALTASRKILFIQALPAFIGLILVILS
jgi:putative membrane protein